MNICKTLYRISAPALAIMLFCSTPSCKKASHIDRQAFGQIVDSVTNEPIANTSFILVSYGEKSIFKQNTYDNQFSFTTNETGTFKVVFEAEKDSRIGIRYPEVNPSQYPYVLVWSGTAKGRQKEFNCGVIITPKQ